jgi:hypothetical protein
VAGDEGGDHLGVGRELGRDAQALDHLEVGVVVHVAVEGAHHVRAVAAPLLLVVEGVGVDLGDDPHAGPAGVAQDRGAGGGSLQRQLQEPVAPHRIP